MHRYLQGRQCYRTSLSEHLDASRHRRWCMKEDIACEVCRVQHEDAIPPREARPKDSHVGLDLIQQGRLRECLELSGYREDLAAVQGTCLLCRAMERRWDHAFSQCSRRHEVFEERGKARRRQEARGKAWLQAYTACYWCLNPQSVCARANPRANTGTKGCEYGDFVLPVCHGVFQSLGGPGWIFQQFGRQFVSIGDFYDWLGEESRYGGAVAVQAVRVAAEAIACFRSS